VDVVLVRWPMESDRRDRVAREGRPRLLLVADDSSPPPVEDPLEDWIRVPAPDSDVRARVDTLSLRALLRTPGRPTLDDDGVIRHNGSWASLAPVESRITQLLVDRCGAVVGRERLTRAGWPDGAPGRNALDVVVMRLRRRLAPAGLAIRTVRSRGYLLEAMPQDAAGEASMR
jgi:two-component system OmpR family response regulator